MKKYLIGNNKQIWSKMVGEDGYLHAHGGALDNKNQTPFPSYSLDLEWEKIPNAKSYAVLIEDFDAAAVIGFSFIHWIAANVKTNKLEANQSYLDHKKWLESKKGVYGDDVLWQGHNSSVCKTLFANNKTNDQLGGILPEGFTSTHHDGSLIYFGCYPPNADHTYTVTVYGLDVEAKELSYHKQHRTQENYLNKPYYVGDFIQAIHNHVVGKHTLHFRYKKVG
ncbi:YbhB/YbcL family Raf kinase inhibitor-like protein [Mycoplasma bradburyae]|uniref:YbhB/YbcL family Raf kinase inhibitor-like protein n=1 Tax=Mycoplasma bradburyae TaxID=2963128 RepID=A0ABT5GAJ0_9MOLU|nr:YbhB/YbcL family Raf kinase inhibitor-like protein [Mycoplasma bradburyae]MDC4181991.1 YbhB/YbcL family Raf kinase inhibitor-like protein [Mycoplasma bradburyae]UTS70416.1 YbhB/YbcL family Raf kinase inhibitor-like protein [Mycoplasma bradburyae]